MNRVFVGIMALLYVAAGVYHFVRPRFYVKIMPPWIPWHLPVVYISGVLEIILGILPVPSVTRIVAAWGIIVLLIAVFPANVQMAINYRRKNHPKLWIALVRLPLQFVLIWLAWLCTKSANI